MKEISTKELMKLIEENPALRIVDVREVEEVATGMIDTAINLPLSSLTERFTELDKNEAHYIICQAGGRSANACTFLASKGYKVTNIAGGMNDW